MWCDHPGCSQQEGYLQCAITVFHNVASRPAKVGDELVTTKFDFLTRGFAAIGEPNVAVCLLPGTEVGFESEVERDHPFGRLLPKPCSSGSLEIRWLDSGRSTWTARTRITTPWNSPTGRSSWSPVFCARASGRRCCSCRPLPASRANRKSKCTPLLSPELSRSCPSGLRDGAGCLRWQELPRFSAESFRLAGVRCIAALWRVKSLLRHRHRPDGLRRRPPCCFCVASWLLRTRRHGVISDLKWTFVHFCSCLPSMQIMTRPLARFAPSA
jgi:hypothetical protein